MSTTLQLAAAGTAASSNLAFALRSLPAERREDALLFYRFCRTVDDIADEPGEDAAAKRSQLEQWKKATETGAGLPAEIARLIERYQIPRELFTAIVEGCLTDTGEVRMENVEELRGYCWKVACAVGLASIRIFGCQSPQSEIYAEHLGHALQLTNIIRDVAEDASLGRVYLPASLLEKWNISTDDLLAGKPPKNLPAALECLAKSAEKEYEEARRNLDPTDIQPLVSAEIMAAIYHKLLGRMRADHFRVFEKRYALSKFQKAVILLKTEWLVRRRASRELSKSASQGICES